MISAPQHATGPTRIGTTVSGTPGSAPSNPPRMRSLDRCLVCGNADHRLVYPSTYHGTTEAAHEYFLARRRASAHGEIRRCNGCGFAFTSPQFEPAEYDQIYAIRKDRVEAVWPVLARGHSQ